MPNETSRPLISVFKSIRNTHGIKKGSSCSRNQLEEQEHPGGTLGITTRSKARAFSVVPSTPTSTLPKEQENPRHEPLITLASLKAPREESPRRYFKLLNYDADSSSSYPVAMQVMITDATSIEE
ncbi:hypothetical protein ACFX1R_039544 [Malus domestica]